MAKSTTSEKTTPPAPKAPAATASAKTAKAAAATTGAKAAQTTAAPARGKATTGKKIAKSAVAKRSGKKTAVTAADAGNARTVKAIAISVRDLAAEWADENNTPRAKVMSMLSGLESKFMERAARGAQINMTIIGSFRQKKRAARLGKNPRTQETIAIAESRTLAFRPSKALQTLLETTEPAR